MGARDLTLCARDPALDLVLDGTRGYLSTDGCPGDMIDLETRRRRGGTKADLAELTRLADALPEIAFMWQCVSANDSPVPVRPIHETHAQLVSTTKHIQQMTAVDGSNARGIVEMARAVAGDADRLRARPLLSNFQCVILAAALGSRARRRDAGVRRSRHPRRHLLDAAGRRLVPGDPRRHARGLPRRGPVRPRR